MAARQPCSRTAAAQFYETAVARWRRASGDSDARVILIGHSMGGLIARYCLEVLGGWEYCRALFTFGTPHRGSVNALNFLCNGYKMLCADMTAALRSFLSVYQLLPNYRIIQVGTEYRRVEELDSIQGVVHERAQQAQAFHDMIRTAATARRALTDVPTSLTFPVVGTQQPTFQSASILNGRVVPSIQLPTTLRERNIPGGGDGTVPYFSAIPAELAGEFRELFVPEFHASLQSHDSVLEQVRQHLARLQSRDWDAILGTREPLQETDQPAISLTLDDLYQTGEPVILRAQVVHTPEEPGALEALLTRLDTPDVIMRYPFARDSDAWTLTLQALPAGLYRVEVQTYSLSPAAPRAVRDIFEIID